MSHFTVMVCITPEMHQKHGNEALTAMMAPYQENNMGDCPKEYLEFQETETEYRENFETGSRSMVRLAGGEVVSRYDDRFYKKDKFGFTSSSEGPNIPESAEEFELPFKEAYASFDEFAEHYHGSVRDPETGQFGYWENPNKKWDYWRVGGRWSGHFPVNENVEPVITRDWDSPKEFKANHTDMCTVSELDWDVIASKMHEAAVEFWDKYVYLRVHGKEPGEDPHPFYGARSTALDLGLLEIVQDSEEGQRRNGLRWGDSRSYQEDDKRADWYDVYNQEITKEEFLAEWLEYFNPIRTYAVLDENGWHEPGSMGWFGCSGAESEDRKEYQEGWLERFIRSRTPDTILVICDCHI